MKHLVLTEENSELRSDLFTSVKRVVIKVGSAVLADENGINRRVVANLAREIAFLHNSGREVILITSGAVAAGKRKLCCQVDNRLTIPEKQAFAAVGQSSLMHDYDEAFAENDKNIAQVLLTHSDLANRKRYLNVRNTILTLFSLGVIPIVNENDTVSTEELKFSDNDNLAALVTNLIEADMFISLTDVDALYDKNPLVHGDARKINTVTKVTDTLVGMVDNSKSALGTGGMRSKIIAAQMVSAGGACSFIGSGRQKNVLRHLFAGKMVGTFFCPQQEKMQGRKRWIAYVLKPRGSLLLDRGACAAISERGKSLLPSGIVEVKGEFGRGESVQCVNEKGSVVAVGLTNYCSDDLEKIKGQRSSKIERIIGYKDYDEVLHRDNMVLM